MFRLERDLGFLRIGSLNVRVKRTTEAFSQFLGVATSASSNEKIHKTWGSADNVQVSCPGKSSKKRKKEKKKRAKSKFHRKSKKKKNHENWKKIIKV